MPRLLAILFVATCTFAVSMRAAAAESGALAQQVRRYRLAHERQIVTELAELVRFRSVAADPKGLAAAGKHLLEALEARGFDARLLPADAALPPLVFGALNASSARHTVVFYAHYDGQPVTASQWSSDPFAPVMRGGPVGSNERGLDWQSAPTPFDPEWRLYGRAVADDKASIIAFLAAFDALRASGRKPAVNIRVLWEGEEESGSPHLEAALRRSEALLTSDLWLIGDGPVHQSGRPLIYFGARGMSGLRLTVYGPIKALHDGHYGNWVPNPAARAASLIAQMRDAAGRILIPGFNDPIRPLTSAELEAIRELPAIESQLRGEFEIADSESGAALAPSLMVPALNVRGIRAGQVGDAAANAIPTDADISIDFRLVPDQTPQTVRQAVEQFLRAKGWTLVGQAPDRALRLAHPQIVRVGWEPGYPALRTDMSSPPALAVIAAARRASAGPLAVLPMMGASAPLYIFAAIFKRPVIGVPIVNHDDNQHAANENLRLQNLWDGIETYASLMATLEW